MQRGVVGVAVRALRHRLVMAKKNKKSALAQAATRRLQAIGMPKMDEEQIAHLMFHAEERGEVERVAEEDGGWAWLMPVDKDGHRARLRPTPKMLESLERFAHMDHNHG